MNGIHTDHAPLRIGDPVPLFQARSTQGLLDLADYKGRWTVLFAHPADFTPVCTSEFIALARAADEFTKRNCALIGVSVDSLYAHLAWVRAIYDLSGVKIAFPLVEDPTLEIARAYGMIGAEAPDAGAVRWTYFIDPQGILRASNCYPATVGRSIGEILRVLAALQRVEDGKALAPADWQPGEDLLAPPNETASAAVAPDQPSGWFYRHINDTQKGGE